MVNVLRNFTKQFSTRNTQSFYVTTPIFYVNAAPHIGHLYSAVIADAVNRYQKIKHPEVLTKFSTGTDEHGIKVQQAANQRKVPVNEYCNKISKEYENIFKLAGVQFTDFIRTSEDRHKSTVKYFWNRLKSREFIYPSTYSGWYCVSDETFLTENQLKLNKNGIKVSAESGHPVEWTEEMNYIFKLSKLQHSVIKWIEEGNHIKPKKFEKILLDYLKEPLPDLSVSRPSSRVHWGIRVPDDESQTIYVWLDALVNYLTCSGYPDCEEMYKNYWPPSLQVIGKDILKFHGIYWPAFLIAADLEPPQCIFVHSHWTVDGEKMSKSKFNVIDPLERANVYTMEGLRYFLLREGVAHSDGNYSDLKVLRILNSELADTFGNLLSRCCAKSLNPYQIFPNVSKHHFQDLLKLDATKYLIDEINQLPEKCEKHYEEHNFYMVVDQIMKTLHAANNFFETCKPWELNKKNNKKSLSKNIRMNDNKCETNNTDKVIVETNAQHENINDDDDHDGNIKKLETIISLTMDTLRICAIILQPVVPDMCKKLLDKLNIPSEKRYWKDLEISKWQIIENDENRHYYESHSNDGVYRHELNHSIDSVLFRRIIIEENSNKNQKRKIKNKS